MYLLSNNKSELLHYGGVSEGNFNVKRLRMITRAPIYEHQQPSDRERYTKEYYHPKSMYLTLTQICTTWYQPYISYAVVVVMIIGHAICHCNHSSKIAPYRLLKMTRQDKSSPRNVATSFGLCHISCIVKVVGLQRQLNRWATSGLSLLNSE